MKRIYDSILKEHFDLYGQMAFLCGPRQVGKTTVAQNTRSPSRVTLLLIYLF